MNIQTLEKELEKLYQSLVDIDQVAQKIGDSVHTSYRLSSINLVRYLMVRSQDLGMIPAELSELGISSIRSCEAYTWRNVSDALKLVKLIQGDKWQPDQSIRSIGYKQSEKLLRKHSDALFSLNNKVHKTKIMVTMPTEAASDMSLIENLLLEGMEVARINLGHDDHEVWEAIAINVKQLSDDLDKPCKIYVDLAGPKIRTGTILIEQDEPVKKKKKKKKHVTNKVIDYIRLQPDDHLILTKEKTNAIPPEVDEDGQILRPAVVGMTLPSVIDDVKVGHRVLFDDGKIKSKVIRKDDHEIEVLIEGIRRAKGRKLKSGKGINLPDTNLHLPSLTKEDIENLPFVIQHADIVGYSFVRKRRDVKELHKQLAKFDRNDLGIVLKIETKEAVENLPRILLQAMKKPKLGVMIARGDLAVEVGARRIAEVQDEILWICEAAHIPVIWATQVLESLAKTGSVTRAEITDASRGVGAECVMLNKGPYITKAVNLLRTILDTMGSHTLKKKSLMRVLKIAEKNVARLDTIVSSEPEEPES